MVWHVRSAHETIKRIKNSVIDPLELARATEQIVVRNFARKYYRLARPARWYGGIATADVVGCNLRCAFCWSGKPRDEPERCGKFYTPEQVFQALHCCAQRYAYRQLRLSGNEPTIGRQHLLALLELVEQEGYAFILETNGILIGNDSSYAKQLSKFSCLHVRVSLKGTTEAEFAKLTSARPECFQLQLKALQHLLDAGVACHAAVMLSFSTKQTHEQLLERLKSIDERIEVESEYVFMYPHVIKRLKSAKLKPLKCFKPSQVPAELV